jgi:hypothetical protein
MTMSNPIELPPVPRDADRPVILARVYPGYHEAAVELFQQDAENLAAVGYHPVGQSYAEGRYATWMIVLAVVLVLVAIGLLMLLYMAAVKPPGSLAVTYELRDAVLPALD